MPSFAVYFVIDKVTGSQLFIRSFSIRSSSIKDDDWRAVEAFRIYDFDSISDGGGVVLDVGCGNGEQTLAQASVDSGFTFIACDPFVRGLSKLAAKLIENKLDNVRLWVGDVRYLIASIPDRRVSKIFIFFPDPWFKNAHIKRRLVGLDFLISISRILSGDGVVYFATDYVPYAEGVLAICEKHKLMKCKYVDFLDIPNYSPTKYHRKALMRSAVPVLLKLSF